MRATKNTFLLTLTVFFGNHTKTNTFYHNLNRILEKQKNNKITYIRI
jgi:hypothetical protein